MSESKIYAVPAGYAQATTLSESDYQRLYAESVNNPEAFWANEAKCVEWSKPFTKVKDVSFDRDDFHVRWYEDGEINLSYNCLDRHLATHPDKTAIIWEGDHPSEQKQVSYRELHREVCRFANALKGEGVKPGDRVTIYMPMIPETAVAMLACARARCRKKACPTS